MTAAPDAPDLAACACGRLRRASRALTQLYDGAMAPAGLRVTQFSLLRTLAREGQQRISRLAESTLLDRTALSRNLDPLIARGLVATVRGRDARTREVALTPAGERALREASPHWRRAQARVRRQLGPRKLDLLIEALGDLEALHPHHADDLETS
jgi:DNA-binding MarR family transcriptional regulator